MYPAEKQSGAQAHHCVNVKTKQERSEMKWKSVIEVYSDMAKSNPAWTAEEERAFVRSCTTKTGKWRSNAAKNKFVNEALKHNLGLVFNLVDKLAFNKGEDVFQKALIGMVGALRKYDPKRGHKISTWITNPIRWAIMQHQNAYAKSGTVADELSALNHKFKMKMRVVSMDTPVNGEVEKETLGSIITIKNLDCDYIIDRNFKTDADHMDDSEVSEAVSNMVKKLPKILNKREEYVIKGVLGGKTLTDISVELRLSKVRISQIQASAFQKIRNSPIGKHLKEYIK